MIFFPPIFTYLDTGVRVGKAPAHVGDVAVIGAGRADQIRALARPVTVVRAEHGCAFTVAPRQRVEILLVGINKVVIRIAVARCVGAAAAAAAGGLEVLGGHVHAVEVSLLRAVHVRQGGAQASSGEEELRSRELHDD